MCIFCLPKVNTPIQLRIRDILFQNYVINICNVIIVSSDTKSGTIFSLVVFFYQKHFEQIAFFDASATR